MKRPVNLIAESGGDWMPGEAAIEMLRPVMANAGANIIRLAANDPNLDNLRDNPQFEQLLASAMERVGLQPTVPANPAATSARPHS